MQGSFDVVIIGAGIIGLSTAWQLARRSRLRILVLEKGAGVGEGSTGASSAVCRYRYSLDTVVQLARDGIHAYRHWGEFTGLREPTARFEQDGVLWLTGQQRGWAAREHARMQGLGIATEVLDDGDLAERFPALSTCTLAPDLETGEEHDCIGGGEHFFEVEGGYMDPTAAASDLLAACRGAGVAVRFNSPVVEIEQAGGAVTAVRLADGTHLAAGCVVNAAGPWCNALLHSAGLSLPWRLSPTRIQIVYLDLPPALQTALPVTVDMDAGIYFRRQNRGQQLVLGSTLESDEQERVADPESFNRLADDSFMQAKLHALHHRIPSLPYTGRVTSYCGLYTVNEQDVHPVIGPTQLAGFYLANGFSGHGFKLAPAAGAMLARMISGEEDAFDTAADPAFFRVDRQPIPLTSKSVLA